MAKILKESVVTCTSLQQAQEVIDRLFARELIFRAEVIQTNVESEIKIIIENLDEDMRKIQQEISKLTGTEGMLQSI